MTKPYVPVSPRNRVPGPLCASKQTACGNHGKLWECRVMLSWQLWGSKAAAGPRLGKPPASPKVHLRTSSGLRPHSLIFPGQWSFQLGLQPPKEALHVLRVLQQPLSNVFLLCQPAVGGLQVGVNAASWLLPGLCREQLRFALKEGRKGMRSGLQQGQRKSA